MAGRANPRNAGSTGVDPQAVVLGLLAGLVLACVVTVQVSLMVAGKLGVKQELPKNPFLTTAMLANDSLVWSPEATVGAVTLWVGIFVVVAVVWKVFPRREKTAIDQAQRFLASSREIADMKEKSVRKGARRLIRDDLANDYPGLRFGTTVAGKDPLFGSWEDLYLVIFGPRSGKTSSLVIPAIVEAPGVVVTTSNKPDVIMTTRAFRQTRGQVWVFDPQDIAVGINDIDGWFFDPLDMVRRDPARMDTAASGLADIFLTASRPVDGKSDAFFEPMGRDLLAMFFLAAALDEKPITSVLEWVNDADDRTPMNILAAHGQRQVKLSALQGQYNTTEKTRSGVFAQAKQMVACLGVDSAERWITPARGRRRFDPAEFVRSGAETMYLLSDEGKGASTAPLTTALVAAIMEAAERYAIECGGRLPVPLVAPLDEAANVVRWRELPSLYSHYGSRGIILMTILQTYSQGVNMWGKTAMETLWSSAAIALVGPGVRDTEFLRSVESLVGEAEVWEKSTSHGRDHRSVSHQVRSKQILTVADLAAIPMGRVLLLPAKRRPAIIATEVWWQRPWPKETKALLEGNS